MDWCISDPALMQAQVTIVHGSPLTAAMRLDLPARRKFEEGAS